MSASYSLYFGPEVTGGEAVLVWDDGNITYNLGPMLRAAGFPEEWAQLAGQHAADVGPMLTRVRDELIADPVKYRNLNPPNGWGDYEGAVAWCDRFAAACARFPKATVWAGL